MDKDISLRRDLRPQRSGCDRGEFVLPMGLRRPRLVVPDGHGRDGLSIGPEHGPGILRHLPGSQRRGKHGDRYRHRRGHSRRNGRGQR